jgi:hypothetical protein
MDGPIPVKALAAVLPAVRVSAHEVSRHSSTSGLDLSLVGLEGSELRKQSQKLVRMPQFCSARLTICDLRPISGYDVIPSRERASNRPFRRSVRIRSTRCVA